MTGYLPGFEVDERVSVLVDTHSGKDFDLIESTDGKIPVLNATLSSNQGERGGCSVPTPGGDVLSSTEPIGGKGKVSIRTLVSIEPAPAFVIGIENHAPAGMPLPPAPVLPAPID